MVLASLAEMTKPLFASLCSSPTTDHQPPTTNSIRFNLKLRIERVNHRAVLILDEISTHLERGGEFPALDREFLIEQRDFLDLLVRREVSGHFVDFLLEVLDDSRVAR